MKSEWVTLHEAALRLTLNGMEESTALNALSIAMHNGEIASRPVQSNGSKTSWEATEMEELRISDLVSWENRILAIGKNIGGRPIEKDWPRVDAEIRRIAELPAGLPGQTKLTEIMWNWANKNLDDPPSFDTMLSHVKAKLRHFRNGS